MSYDLTIQPPAAGLDPRDRSTVDAWIKQPPTGPIVPRGELRELANELSRMLDAELYDKDRRFEMVAEQSGVILVISETGGWYEGTPDGLEAVWPALEELCDRTGWVVFDPQLDKIILGYHLVCSCGATVDPYDATCHECETSTAEARIPQAIAPPTLKTEPWEERALAQLENRELIRLRAVNRALVVDTLSVFARHFQDEPSQTTEQLIATLERMPSVDELYGEADEIEAALKAAGPA
ncbi:MAG TPA: hypothetical protein VGM90_33830 [Kofleriaceae bacterium]